MTRRGTAGRKKLPGKKRAPAKRKKALRRRTAPRMKRHLIPASGRQRPRRTRILRARDLMTRTPIKVNQDLPIGELCDLLQANNINGAPVVDEQGYLLGVVTQEDIIYGAMGSPGAPTTEPAGDPDGRRPKPRGKRVMDLLRGRSLSSVPSPTLSPGELPFWADDRRPRERPEVNVAAIMTSPAISADENTPIVDLCRIMWNLRIHRVPILKDGKVTGLVSSMDLCRAILTGKISV